MWLFGWLILLSAFWTPIAVEYPPVNPSKCLTLQPVITTTVTHTLEDIQIVTSTFYNNITVFTTTTEDQTGNQGLRSVTTIETLRPFIITKTTLDITTVTVPKLETVMMPLRVTTTIVSIFTFTKTTYMDFVITKTSVVHKLAHQDLYQTSLTIIKTPVTVPTCTMEVTVDVSTPRGFTSTSDILVISTATTTLYVTSESTTTSTVMLDSGFESNGRHKGVDEVSNEM